jgi:serine/threonine-protein kinase HipA
MNGKRKDIEIEDLMKVAKAMNIKKADKIVSQIADVVSRWDEYAKRVGVEKKLQMAIQRTLILL